MYTLFLTYSQATNDSSRFYADLTNWLSRSLCRHRSVSPWPEPRYTRLKRRQAFTVTTETRFQPSIQLMQRSSECFTVRFGDSVRYRILWMRKPLRTCGQFQHTCYYFCICISRLRREWDYLSTAMISMLYSLDLINKFVDSFHKMKPK